MSNKPGLLFYGLAGLVFLLGIADFCLYLIQTYGSIEEGLADLFAWSGLGAWWVVAAVLAYVGNVKARRAAAAQAAATPDVEITFEEGQETEQPINPV
jgi:hypothetical protein